MTSVSYGCLINFLYVSNARDVHGESFPINIYNSTCGGWLASIRLSRWCVVYHHLVYGVGPGFLPFN